MNSEQNPYKTPESDVKNSDESKQDKKSMQMFDVYEKEGEELEAIKRGFSWTGLFFGALWAFLNELYGIGLALVIIYIGLKYIEPLVGGFIVAPYFLIPITIGWLGNDFKRSKLLRKGYSLSKSVYAEDTNAAILASPIEEEKPIYDTISTTHEEWTNSNDNLVQAILEGNGQPQIAVEKIKEILEDGANINAKNESGRTVLSIANYNEVPSVIKSLLINAGAKT